MQSTVQKPRACEGRGWLNQLMFIKWLTDETHYCQASGGRLQGSFNALAESVSGNLIGGTHSNWLRQKPVCWPGI